MAQPFIQKSIPYVIPALKVTSFIGVALAAGALGQDELIKGLIDGHSAEASALMESGLDLVKSLCGREVVGAGAKLLEIYQRTVKDDFEKAFHTAIANALTTIEVAYRTSHPTSNQHATITLFFTELRSVLTTTSVSEADIEQYIINRQYFLHNAKDLDKLAGLDDTLPDDLFLFIEEQYGSSLQRELLKQLKNNAKAQTAYVVSLLELNVRYGAANTETLDAVKRTLLELSNTVAAMQNQGSRITQILSLIHDEQRKLGVDVRDGIRQVLDEIRRNKQQPKLYDYIAYQKSADKAYRYDYKAAYTTFIGRKAELAQLETFVLPDPQAKFRWWLITGPGGMGKSRLAQTVCMTFNQIGSFYAGFLEGDERGKVTNFDWDNWQPACHTVIVLDYVSTRVDEVRAIINTLANRVSEFDYSVRLLLLERTTDGPWWDTIRTHGASLGQYAEQPLVVPPFTDDDRWHIIEEVHQKVTEEHRSNGEPLPIALPDKRETLRKLTELDRFNRPLFAFFVGMALSDGKTIRDWDVHTLLKHILNEHERVRWWGKKSSLDDEQQRCYERLLALATITSGLSRKQWQEVSHDIVGLPTTSNYDILVLNRMGGFTRDNLMLQLLEPDILGEFFVAEVLHDWQTLYDDGTNVPKLIGHAWQLAPEHTWAFAERLLVDFPKAGCMPLFWADLHKTSATEEALTTAIAWSSFQVNLTHSRRKGRHESLANPAARYEATIRLRAEAGFASELTLALRQANAATNLTVGLEASKAANYYEAIVKLRTEASFASQVQLAIEQAKTACNLVIDLCARKQLDEAIKYYEAIVKLRTEGEFASQVELALLQAKAATSLTANLEANKSIKYYKAIIKLRTEADFALQVELAIEQAKIVVNLTAHSEVDNAFDYYKDIVELRKEHDFAINADIAVQQAIAARNLLTHLSVARRWTEAFRYYRDIIGLREERDFTFQIEIAPEQVKAEANLIATLGQDRLRFLEAIGYYGQLTTLVRDFRNDPFLLPQLAWASNALLAHLFIWKQERWLTPVIILDPLISFLHNQLRHLYETVDDPAVRVEYGKAISLFMQQPEIDSCSVDLFNYWISVTRILIAKDSTYPDEHWQQLVPAFIDGLSSMDEVNLG